MLTIVTALVSSVSLMELTMLTGETGLGGVNSIVGFSIANGDNVHHLSSENESCNTGWDLSNLDELVLS